MHFPIFLDHNSTTPVAPEVIEAIRLHLLGPPGNPASRTHSHGWSARDILEESRSSVARLIGARPREVILTSGATEANNLAILGCAAAAQHPGHLVTCATEHRSVLDPVKLLERQGWRVTRLATAGDGTLHPETLESVLADDTVLVTVMLANNETGVILPIADISRLCRQRGILFHTDAAQAIGKIPVDCEQLGVDMMSISGHKMYAPQGIGALRVRSGIRQNRIAPILHGGGQEGGLRGGTVAVGLTVALAAAAELCRREINEEGTRLEQLTRRLWSRLREDISGIERNGAVEPCLPGTLNLSIAGVETGSLLLALPEISLAAGSACTSAELEPSHVLRAMGIRGSRARSAIRISLGRGSTRQEIDYTVSRIAQAVEALRHN